MTILLFCILHDLVGNNGGDSFATFIAHISVRYLFISNRLVFIVPNFYLSSAVYLKIYEAYGLFNT